MYTKSLATAESEAFASDFVLNLGVGKQTPCPFISELVDNFYASVARTGRDRIFWGGFALLGVPLGCVFQAAGGGPGLID